MLVQHGQDIQLTIDANLQVSLYEQFKEDKSCSVAMNPYTGEVLALVSTPSYDNNDFIMGLSSEQWTALDEDENKPMYNRFRQVWCPGSTFKPITAAIGLESGAIDPMEDYGNVGLSWQKDASWGSYHVTTLHAYESVILENALIYSVPVFPAKRMSSRWAAYPVPLESFLHIDLHSFCFADMVIFYFQCTLYLQNITFVRFWSEKIPLL